MAENHEPEKLARCARCRYATDGLDGTTCPECGTSVLPVQRDGYTADGVRKAVYAAAFTSGVNVTAVVAVAMSEWYITFLMILTVCVFMQIGCFLLTMFHLPAWSTVREDYAVRRWVPVGFLVNMVGFAGCLGAVALAMILDGTP